MKTLKKTLIWLGIIFCILYLCICGWFYFSQEKALFTGVKLKKDHVFSFSGQFEEKFIPMGDGVNLHGVLFKAKEPKGVILWFPGGRGMIDSIGLDAPFYTKMNYDLFVINFRGFGKSEGTIKSEKQFNQDMQTVYNFIKKDYGEDRIVIFGYSLGSGPAAALASANKPGMLILRAPYYSMTKITQKAIPYLPMALLLKYKFPIYELLQTTSCPVVVIHGDADNKIPIETSYRLKEHFKSTDRLLVLKGQGHNDFEKNPEYLQKLSEVLK